MRTWARGYFGISGVMSVVTITALGDLAAEVPEVQNSIAPNLFHVSMVGLRPEAAGARDTDVKRNELVNGTDEEVKALADRWAAETFGQVHPGAWTLAESKPTTKRG